jgi:endonuclease/exonuclease/phosphatase family metal-dependent hydrolase
VQDTTVAKGVTQILTGDMNAEPQERAMKFLIGTEEIQGMKTDFVDAWLALHPEPTPRSNATNERDEMLTFPSDQPSKRIDFIFLRGKGADQVKKTWLVGQTPLSAVGNATNDKGEHIGMVDANSRVWASDHRGLVTNIGGGGA